MIVPRYLQVTLALTLASVIWSVVSSDERDDAPVRPVAPAHNQPTAHRKSADSVMAVHKDLFALSHADKENPATTQAKAEPPPPQHITPALPLSLLGIWWEGHQRIILLTDGRDTWPVCHHCRAENAIWIGNEPVEGWKLKAVNKDDLLFEWQLTHTSQHLEISDLQSEPTQ